MMSDITLSRQEVGNGHTDLICSTAVSHSLAVRKTTLLQIDTLIRHANCSFCTRTDESYSFTHQTSFQ